MRVEVRTDDSALVALDREWGDLHRGSSTATLYNTSDWARVWWRHFGEPDGLRLFLVRDDAGTLVGLAPMQETLDGNGRAVLRYLGGLDVSDYLDALALAGREQDVADALARAWVDQLCHNVSSVELHAIRDASPLRGAFSRLAPGSGSRLEMEQDDVCPVVTLPSSWEAYLNQLEGKQRRELRRKVRKAGQDVLVSWYQVRGGSRPELDEAMETFFDLHARSDPMKATFMTPRMRAFFRDVAEMAARAGWLALDVLLVNGQPAATQLTFDYDNQILLYNSGYDPHVAADLSPGWLLLSFAIEHAIMLGRRRFDFLRGSEEYKYRFGGRPEHLWRLRWECGCARWPATTAA